MVSKWKWVIVLHVGGLLLVDLMVQALVLPLSGDYTRLSEYDKHAESRRVCGATDVTMLGNSAAELGVDESQLRSSLGNDQPDDACLEVLLADGSGMTTWRAMLRHYIWSRNRHPGIVLLVAPTEALADEETPDAGRIGRYLTSGSEWRTLLTQDSLPWQVSADALVSRLSASWAARRLGWRRAARYLAPWWPSDIGTSSPPAEPSYRALSDVRMKINRDRARLVVVIFPPEFGERRIPHVLQEIMATGGCVLDVRNEARLEPSDYASRLHLRASGRSKFTGALAMALRGIRDGQPCT